MPRYSKLEEVDNVVYGAGDATWTPKRLIDRLIIAKAAYPLLTELGDRVPLLEEEEITMPKSGSKTSRIKRMIGRLIHKLF